MTQFDITSGAAGDGAQASEGGRCALGQVGKRAGYRRAPDRFLDKVEAETPVADAWRRGPVVEGCDGQGVYPRADIKGLEGADDGLSREVLHLNVQEGAICFPAFGLAFRDYLE